MYKNLCVRWRLMPTFKFKRKHGAVGLMVMCLSFSFLLHSMAEWRKDFSGPFVDTINGIECRFLENLASGEKIYLKNGYAGPFLETRNGVDYTYWQHFYTDEREYVDSATDSGSSEDEQEIKEISTQKKSDLSSNNNRKRRTVFPPTRLSGSDSDSDEARPCKRRKGESFGSNSSSSKNDYESSRVTASERALCARHNVVVKICNDLHARIIRLEECVSLLHEKLYVKSSSSSEGDVKKGF